MKIIITSSLLALCFSPVSWAAQSSTDPLASVMWDFTRAKFIGETPYVFDDAVKVMAPAHAEDPTQVPIMVDASAFDGQIERVVAWADLNPIHHIFSYYPHPEVTPKVSMRIKVQQATPVRAAVLTQDGVWHVGSTWVEAAGGGCTTPSLSTASPLWESALGQIKARQFSGLNDSARYKLRVIHPMDTGLADGIPEFFIEQVQLRDSQQATLARMDLSQPVSENPVFTFDVKHLGQHHIWMRDNNGNEFSQPLAQSHRQINGEMKDVR
ncbi:MAG: quinoprotein dehydrogenase-associated SoxYZ-like carrier [Pontibacterium sp.]